ncbi:uncharacterized protein BO66DRAFT_439815 [Aspergillus aculeatinus CBS 121060]|uniref:Uncharacterized protein n=1 Tax=Aspergillus aculeatinus CBS 121060 TaxID=1448322 RepID=A0ACD1H5E4_9EURO|nr:hypothetical protein BO66DRAFT_439815 [Aspergillus aculeatinus CBS 121060]RAH68804.1 hypothetical protein BO66DRAFT_439815 [Aspergillus aculeatinus CBS 121060]
MNTLPIAFLVVFAWLQTSWGRPTSTWSPNVTHRMGLFNASDVPPQLICPAVGKGNLSFPAHIYNDTAIEAVLRDAVTHTGAHQIPPTGPPSERYAHQFGKGLSPTNLTFTGYCASKNDTFEFPILPDGTVYDGTVDQGIDRVIYSRLPSLRNPTFCALLRHNMTILVDPPFLRCQPVAGRRSLLFT